MGVDAQKMARSQVLAEFKDDPLMNGKAIRKTLLETASIDNPEVYLQTDPAPNPELLAKLAELEIKKMAAKAQTLVQISQAIKNMADADSKVQEPYMHWVRLNMDQLKNEYEAIGGGNAPNEAGNPADAGGIEPGAMGGMAAPPNNAGISPIPGGLPDQFAA